MEKVEHKYHAEVKSKNCQVRINIFAKDLRKLFKDLETVCYYLGYDESPIGNVIASAAKQSPTPNGGNGACYTPGSPCTHCGAVDAVELVKWTDKATGQARQAPKCQSCSKWLW